MLQAKTSLMAACIALAGTQTLFAGPVEVNFTPPDMEPQQICSPKPPDHVVAARWEDWSGEDLGDRETTEVRRDLRILSAIDASAWFDTIARAEALMRDQSNTYSEAEWMRDRISLLLAAGRRDQFIEEGLAEKLVELAPGESGSIKSTAAGLLMAGQGVPRDRAAALDLYRAAAYEGHPDAIMELARLSSEGTDVPDWNIAPDVAVTMAFGARLGDADAFVCGRINQIASYFAKGELVQKDADLAEDWYRFSASLGDYNAAWRVARYHLDAEEIQKDNDVMLAHLRQAAEGQLPYAMTELAQLLERGALVDRDIPAAQALYEQAAAYGDLTAYTRLANLARRESDGSPEDLARIIALLTSITELPNPPAWAFPQLSDAVLRRDGRWAGEDRARQLLDRALDIDPDHSASLLRKARFGLRYVETPSDFSAVTSRLRAMVRENGRTEFMQALQRAYMCRSPRAPMLEKAEFWHHAEEISGDMTVPTSDLDGTDQSAPEALVTVAQLQSQALNDRARSLAGLTQVLGDDGSASISALIARARRNEDPVYTARGLTALDLGQTDRAIAEFTKAVDAGEAGAELDLARLIAQRDPTGDRLDRFVRLATDAAHGGSGRAINMLIEVDPDMTPDLAWETFAKDIERNGDSRALTFALPYLDDPARVEDYLGRIQAVIPCHAADSIQLARALAGLDRPETARHWFDVAEAEAQGSDWEMVALADALMQSHSLVDDARGRAVALYRASAETGYPLAFRKLLTLRKEGRVDIPVEDATQLYVDFVDVSPMADIASALNLLRFSDPELRRAVEDRIDVRGLYETAAEQGDPTAELELAKMVRDDGGPDAISRYADLVGRSARQGNAEAMMRLSRAYAYGIGTSVDPEASRDWLLKAADAGNEAARETVDMMTPKGTDQ